ncbi:MAG TPA: hypothetical protein VMV79_01275 [Alphaproteobacteria bacterium]|nr:hypothetical protein [Alphaproteobacteria bacterium]
MTPNDFRLYCRALGFATVFATGVPENVDGTKASRFAELIEAFCLATIPDAFGPANANIGDEGDPAALDLAIDRYKAELAGEGSARLPDDRATLLKFYDRLHQRQARRRERHFYATGSDEMIANRVLQLIEEEIEADEAGT